MRNAHRKNWWHHLSKSIPINVGENRFLWEKFEVRRNQTGLARVIGVRWNRKIKRKAITKSLIQHHKTLFGQSLWCTLSANARKHCIIYDKISPICKLQYEKNSTKTLAHNIWMKFFGKLKVQRFSIRWIVMFSQIQIRFVCFFIWSPRQRFRKYHCFWI